MKKKISISIEETLDERLESLSQNPLFRNKSHVIEYAIEKFLRYAKTTGGGELHE